MNFKKMRGNASFIILISVIASMPILFIFITAFLKNSLNSVLHNAKNDIYLIGKNAVFAIERNIMAFDKESFFEEDILKFVKMEIANSWNLDGNLQNGKGIIERAEILELNLLKEGEVDNVTNEKTDETILHNLILIYIKPVMPGINDEVLCFKLHEDIKIRKMKK